ncbi:MATE family efflux transporter [Streptococcus cuniculipharyngis]|uniref:Probable multidrug resistance protein NorM n=1 Tax=Streptococcus cuniculipharyngis TaxID=1562651 RepID=A0A5C5SBA3_9STRE|nr:MATE family efflux transporter [Streptococcus cuniculipharyngis]TWS97171.1 hypothetical protein FRX57_06130 [Streptococcus cuniculipharyngis]
MNKTSSRLLKIALPVMLENFLQALMGLVDSYMVAQLGLLTISGVAVANQIMTVYQAIFMALAAGTSSFFAQAMAKKDKDLEDLASRQILFLTIFLGMFLGMVSLVGGPYLL